MSAAPVIRRAGADDAADLARLISPLGYALSAEDVSTRWPAWVAGDNLALVLEEEGRLVGVVTLHVMRVLHRARPVGRVTSLAVEPAAQGRGYGRALMRAVEEASVAAGCGILELTSHRRRTEAHTFYLHLGYEQTSFRFARTFPEPPEGP